jgi:hypothetical protein
MLLGYQVLPAQISCDWTAKLYLRVDAGTIAQCKDDVLLVQRGGLYPCQGPADWLEPGEPAAGRVPYDGAIERVPVRPCEPSPPPCSQCVRTVSCPAPAIGGLVPAYSSETMTVSGRIFALQEYADSYLGNLRLRILAGTRLHPKPAGQGPAPQGANVFAGRVLAEPRLTPCGRFDVCIERVPYFVLEVTATDWTSCQEDYSAETLLPGGVADRQRDRWVAYSYPFSPLQVGCQWQKDVEEQYIDAWGYTPIQAAAFFPATMIALDMREYMAIAQPTGAGVNIGQENYRAHIRYPETGPNCLTDTTPPAPSDACFRNPPAPGYIYLQAGYADKWDVVTHEYGHDAHNALGSGWVISDTTQFPEGVAEFIRGVKESLDNYSCDPEPYYKRYRGGCDGRPSGLYGCSNGPWMELLPTQAYKDPMYLYAGWLYDVWDPTAISYTDSMPEARATCPSDICDQALPITDALSVPFGELWETFWRAYQVPTPGPTPTVDPNSAPFPLPAQAWIQQWMNDHLGDEDWARCGPEWRKLVTVSVHHRVYTDTACSSFPASPSP